MMNGQRVQGAYLDGFRDAVDRLLGRFLSGRGRSSELGAASRGFSAVNVWEDDESVFVETEIPGSARRISS